MTDKPNRHKFAQVLNGYSFEFWVSDKSETKPELKSMGFYDTRDNTFYESDDLTVCFCLALFARRKEKLLPAISPKWWSAVENYFKLPIYSKNLPETDPFKAFVKGVEIPSEDEEWFPPRIWLLTSRGTHFQMELCNVLKQMRELTLSDGAALPPIFSDELTEEDWWHRAMGCHFHECPYGSHYC